MSCAAVTTIAEDYVSIHPEIHVKSSLFYKATHLVGALLAGGGPPCPWSGSSTGACGNRALYLQRSISSLIDERLVIEESGMLRCLMPREEITYLSTYSRRQSRRRSGQPLFSGGSPILNAGGSCLDNACLCCERWCCERKETGSTGRLVGGREL